MPQVKRQASAQSSASRLPSLKELPLRRLLLATITVGLLFFSLWARVLPPRVDWQAADTADRTIKAPRSAGYTATEATSKLRDEEAAKVTNQYSSVADAEAGVRRAINEVFSQAQEIHQPSTDQPATDRMAALRKHIVLDLSEATLRTLLEKPPAALDQIKAATQELASTQMEGGLRKGTDDLGEARLRIVEQAQQLNLTPAATQAATEIAQLTIKPNLVFDPELTEQKRAAARQAVAPITRTLQAGEIIISTGETVTSHHMDMFRAVGLVNPVVDYSQALGILILLALLVAILWAFALRFTPEVYGDMRQMALLSVVVIAATLVFRMSQQSSYFEAIVLATATAGCMVIALATRPVLGSFLALLLGPLVGLATPSNDVRIVVVTIVCGLFAANVSTIRGSWTRTITRTAVAVGLGNALILVIATAAFDLSQQWHIAGATAVGGVAAALLSVGVIVVLQGPLQLLTDLRLMELSNPNEPILRQLRREAPASYQSSIMVANLAEQAAEAIGANSLLTHTAAMYHDIGKIKRPYFFVENQFGGENPHDKLSPHLSALVITAHVKDGLQLAEDVGLPQPIANAIPQSHGTYLIRYFYEKACDQAEEGEEVSKEEFRYPGPRPQTRENAIVMLADIVEAAARTLDDPTPTNVQALVNRLVDGKIEEGQLDECPLTFAEVDKLKQSLIDSLNTMFHQRIKYPDQIERDAEEVAKAYGQSTNS